MLNGDIPIYFDIYLSKLLNIEFGAGIICPYYIVGYSFEEYQQTILNSDSGYSLWLHPKLFFNRKDNKDSFCSVAYRYRAFNEGTLTTTMRDIYLNWGYSIIYPSRIALDVHVGLGYRFTSYNKPQDYSRELLNSHLLFPIHFKIGYSF